MSDVRAISDEGIRDLYVALKDLEPALAVTIREGLLEVGDVIRDDAAAHFRELGGDDSAPSVAESHAATAEGFKTRVRTSGEQGLVQVEQSKAKTTGAHPEYGDLEMKKGLLPARDEGLPRAAAILERRVVGTLRQHGLT